MSSIQPFTSFSIENRNQQESHSHLFLVTPTDKSHEITHWRDGRRERNKISRWFQLESYRYLFIYLRLGLEEQTLNSHHELIESSLMKADTSISPGHHQRLAVFSQYPAMLTGWRVNTGEGARKAQTCTPRAEPLTENNWTTAMAAWMRNREDHIC